MDEMEFTEAENNIKDLIGEYQQHQENWEDAREGFGDDDGEDY